MSLIRCLLLNILRVIVQFHKLLNKFYMKTGKFLVAVIIKRNRRRRRGGVQPEGLSLHRCLRLLREDDRQAQRLRQQRRSLHRRRHRRDVRAVPQVVLPDWSLQPGSLGSGTYRVTLNRIEVWNGKTEGRKWYQLCMVELLWVSATLARITFNN